MFLQDFKGNSANIPDPPFPHMKQSQFEEWRESKGLDETLGMVRTKGPKGTQLMLLIDADNIVFIITIKQVPKNVINELQD